MNFHRNYSVAVIFTQDHKIILQGRSSLKNSFHKVDWGFFGGGVEESETFEQALVREIREELGIDIKEKFTHIGSTFLTLDAHGTQETHMYAIPWSQELQHSYVLGEGDDLRSMTLDEFEACHIAPWSHIAIDMLRDYFSS